MEVISPTLYVTVQLVEHSLILHLVLTVVLVESLVHLPHWVDLVEEQPTTSGWQLWHQVDEDHTVKDCLLVCSYMHMTIAIYSKSHEHC